MLSTWPKDGHTLSVSCMPLHLCSCSWVLSGSRSTPSPAWFSDVLIFPKFWHLTNLWHDFLSLHDLLWPICSFLLPCSVGLPCERSVANGFYFFPVFLLSLPIISASLSNICTVAVVAWNPVHTLSSLLYCALVFWVDYQLSQCPVGLHGRIYSIRNRPILSAVSDNPSTYGITANPLLSCTDLLPAIR